MGSEMCIRDRFKPITNTLDLNLTARAMGNCLASFNKRCLANTIRIFTGHDKNDNLLFAAGITRSTNGVWRLNQIEGIVKHTSVEQYMPAFRKMRQLYQEAEIATKKLEAAA